MNPIFCHSVILSSWLRFHWLGEHFWLILRGSSCAPHMLSGKPQMLTHMAWEARWAASRDSRNSFILQLLTFPFWESFIHPRRRRRSESRSNAGASWPSNLQCFHFPLLIFPAASTYWSQACQEYCSARRSFLSFFTVRLFCGEKFRFSLANKEDITVEDLLWIFSGIKSNQIGYLVIQFSTLNVSLSTFSVSIATLWKLNWVTYATIIFLLVPTNLQTCQAQQRKPTTAASSFNQRNKPTVYVLLTFTPTDRKLNTRPQTSGEKDLFVQYLEQRDADAGKLFRCYLYPQCEPDNQQTAQS